MVHPDRRSDLRIATPIHGITQSVGWVERSETQLFGSFLSIKKKGNHSGVYTLHTAEFFDIFLNCGGQLAREIR